MNGPGGNKRRPVAALALQVGTDAENAARRAALIIESAGHAAIAARGEFLLALSGGSTPLSMFRALAGAALDWSRVHLFQVDERVSLRGSEARNLSAMESAFAGLSGRLKIYPMPVDDDDLIAAAEAYAQGLQRAAAVPAVLDMIHLGLGQDGHTASLFPGDPALNMGDRDVCVTGDHHGRLRMTMTLPLINRARARLFLTCGESKSAMAAQLLDADRRIPAGLVERENSWLIMDRSLARALVRGPDETP